MDIGFIGLGTMGRPMVAKLLEHGHTVWVYNRSRSSIEWAVSQGAHALDTPAAIGARASIVMSALPYPETVESVYFGENGVYQGLQERDPASAPPIWVDLSTIGPQHAERFAERAKALGVSFLDAPVSGGPMGVQAGTLTVMVGGEAEAFHRVRPVLEAFATNIVHVGPSGKGSVVKLINNMLVAVHTVALSEAFVLGVQSGIDSDVIYELIKVSTGHSYMIDRAYPLIKERDFAARFNIALLHKDVRLALDYAARESVPLEQVALASQTLVRALALGLGQDDIAAIIRPLEQMVGVEVKKQEDPR